jgi:WD40 repeat protein
MSVAVTGSKGREDKTMRTLTIPRGGFRFVRYSGRGRLLVSLDTGETARLWDLDRFTQRRVVPKHSAQELPFFFHPGGEWLLQRHGYWSKEEDLPVALTDRGRPPTRPFGAIAMIAVTVNRDQIVPAFAPGGEMFGPRYNRHYQLTLYDMQGRPCKTLLYPERSAIDQAAFSPDGRLLAVGGRDDFRVVLWDLSSGELTRRPNLPWGLYRMAFSPDSRLLATGTGPMLRLWDVATGQMRSEHANFEGVIRTVAFSPDGRLLAAGSSESRVVLWEVASGRQLAEYNWNIGAINDLSFAPDCATAAAAGAKKTIVVWDVD